MPHHASPPLALAFALLASIALPAAARADACDTLLSQLGSQLSSPETSASDRLTLQRLLDTGRAAKAAGNTAICEQALQGASGAPPAPLRSPMPARGRGCHEQPQTS